MKREQNMTLRQSLTQFNQTHKRQLSHNHEELPKEVQAFFKSHDIAHVLFGCDISLFGKGSVKIWTIFGTTLGFWNHLRAYKKADAYALTQNFGLWPSVANIFKLLVYIPVIIYKSKRMHKPWPWSAYEPYLGTELAQLRAEFNIRIIE